MEKGFKIKIIIIIFLIVILLVMLFKYNAGSENNYSRTEINTKEISNNNISTSSETIVSSKAQIQSALTENISLHTTYYLEEVYVQANETVNEGDKILKYTNGEYLTAPYNCVINELNLPEIEGQCKNDNYISISSINRLQISVNVSEDVINQLYIGQEANITISSLSLNKTGYITNISSTASNGNFTVIVEFENESDIKIGMTATIEI